ncbi:MAG: hypothetical protein COB51_01000 [Moraxellaceae bacterium]|nr:MAG: hypothetical protein COB51_01000 [Moraxellaceae bacterium]
MAKVVFFNMPGATGHINPTLGWVEELISRGEQVIYYAGEDSRHKLSRLGAEYRTYDSWFDYSHSADGSTELIPMALIQLRLAEACCEGLIAELREESPDYIIYDSCCIWGKYIAEALGIPAINSLTTLVSSPYVLISDYRLGAHIVKELLLGVGKVFSARKRLIKLFKKIGVRYRGLIYHVFDIFANVGDLNIVFNTKQYQPFVNQIKGNFKYVGASVPENRDAVSEQFNISDNNPLVYISLGTVNNTNLNFFKNCVQAFSNKPYDVIMSVGESSRIQELGPLPNNIQAYAHVPQLHLLKHASAFITHGGMNSLNEGLYYGVPLVIYPQQVEQAFNGRRFQKMGLAKLLGSESPSAKDLYDAVVFVIEDPAMKGRAKAYGDVLKTAGGVVTAADEVLDYPFKKKRLASA